MDTQDTETTEHPMIEAAMHAVAQGWCEPEASHMEMDATLATAISQPVSRSLIAWYDTAAQHARNEEYYRGLLIKIGEILGPEAYISDDGSVQDHVLCAKVPDLVIQRLEAVKELLHEIDQYYDVDDGIPSIPGPIMEKVSALGGVS